MARWEDGYSWSALHRENPARHAEVSARGRAASLRTRQAKAQARREAALCLLAQGLSVREVARQMGVSKSLVGRCRQDLEANKAYPNGTA